MQQNTPSPADIDFPSEIGAGEPLIEPDVDITLHPSRDTPIAGELWSVSGTISNRSTFPIWIVDETTTLSLNPEMYGQASQTGSIGAFFPTVKSRPFVEIIRIDPGAIYSVVWKIDPNSSSGVSGAKQSIPRRIINSVKGFSFFNPGQFRITATVHIWSVKPVIDQKGRPSNLGDSFVRSISNEITMDSSPWVLLLGAAIGGLLCFILQVLFGTVDTGDGFIDVAKSLFGGVASAMILCGVVTVLLSRLATTDFILVSRIIN